MKQGNSATRFVSSMILFVLFASIADAASSTFSKDGNQLTSSSGDYTTSTHCSGTPCTWVSGNQVIIGVYNSGFTGGTVCYTLSGVPTSSVTSASLKIEWPSSYGKGLHARYDTGKGSVTVNSHTIASLITDYGICSTTGDYYAHACGSWSLDYSVPSSYLTSSPSVCITANNGAIWDVSKITLTVNTQDPAPTCSFATSCTQTYTSGSTTYYCRDFGFGYKWYTASEGVAFCDASAEVSKKASCSGTEFICSDSLKWVGCKSTQACATAVSAKGVQYYCRNFNSAGYKWSPCAKCNSLGCAGISAALNYPVGTVGTCLTSKYSCTSTGWKLG